MSINRETLLLRAAEIVLETSEFVMLGEETFFLNQPDPVDGSKPLRVTPEVLALIVAKADELEANPPAPDPLRNLEPDAFWGMVWSIPGMEEDLIAWANAIPDPVSRGFVLGKLKLAKFYERFHPFVEEARAAMGMTTEQLNDLWAYANQ